MKRWNEILLWNKKEWTTNTCKYMDEPQKDNTKWKTSDSKTKYYMISFTSKNSR